MERYDRLLAAHSRGFHEIIFSTPCTKPPVNTGGFLYIPWITGLPRAEFEKLPESLAGPDGYHRGQAGEWPPRDFG